MFNITHIASTPQMQRQPEHMETANIVRRAMYEYRRKIFNGAKKQGKKITFHIILDSTQ